MVLLARDSAGLAESSADYEIVVDQISDKKDDYSQPDGEYARGRAAQMNVVIDLKKVSPAAAKQLRDAAGQNRRLTFKLPRAAVADECEACEHLPRSSCFELPFSEKEFLAAATSKPKDGIVGFLKQIPPGTMQTFTLVYKSESGQAHRVRPDFPRVIRSNADGTLTFTYVCDPKSKDYGKVEVMKVERETGKHTLLEIDLKTGHVDTNRSTCLDCHGSNPHAIVRQYPGWEGWYGSNDDEMVHPADHRGLGYSKEESAASLKEYKSFVRFRELQAQNPCYSLLPWADLKPLAVNAKVDLMKSPDGRPNLVYPYFGGNARQVDLKQRPNLKLTTTFSRHNANRLAHQFIANPAYRSVKYLLSMETLGCSYDVGAALAKRLPGYLDPRRKAAEKRDGRHRFDPRTGEGWSPKLYAAGEALGFKPSDWTLNTAKNPDPEYNPGTVPGLPSYGSKGKRMFPDHAVEDSDIRADADDIPMGRMVQTQLLKNLAKEIPELGPLIEVSKSYGRSGEEYACIDALGGELMMKADARAKACAMLQVRQAVLDAYAPPSCASPLASFPEIADACGSAHAVTAAVPERRPASGRALFESECLRCHHSDLPKTEAELKKKLAAKPGLKAFILQQVEAPNGWMPPGQGFKSNPKPEQRDRLERIVKYLKSL